MRACLFADLRLKVRSTDMTEVVPVESEPIGASGPGVVFSFGSNGYGRLGLGMKEEEYRDGCDP
jgi:hypothetical protein